MKDLNKLINKVKLAVQSGDSESVKNVYIEALQILDNNELIEFKEWFDINARNNLNY